MKEDLQSQYDKIYSYFKTTTEPYDSLEWDGEELQVVLNDLTIERYTYADLCDIISDFA